MAAVVREFPAVPAFRTTLALLRTLEGQASLAMQAFQGTGWELAQTSDTDRLIYATVLRLNGKGEEALAVEAQVQWEKVSPEEVQLLRRLGNPSNG